MICDVYHHDYTIHIFTAYNASNGYLQVYGMISSENQSWSDADITSSFVIRSFFCLFFAACFLYFLCKDIDVIVLCFIFSMFFSAITVGLSTETELEIFLCCEALDVSPLIVPPPIVRSNSGQAMYHFASGYTAEVAETEGGIEESISNFSPCYGAAFLTSHPMKSFENKLEQFNVPCYLVNTGCGGGRYDVGKRMSIRTTRSCINSINNATFRKDSICHFQVPDSKLLDARDTWTAKDEYDEQCQDLGQMFAHNFEIHAQDGQKCPEDQFVIEST